LARRKAAWEWFRDGFGANCGDADGENGGGHSVDEDDEQVKVCVVRNDEGREEDESAVDVTAKTERGLGLMRMVPWLSEISKDGSSDCRVVGIRVGHL
jgi:hypothetical protein